MFGVWRADEPEVYEGGDAALGHVWAEAFGRGDRVCARCLTEESDDDARRPCRPWARGPLAAPECRAC